MRLPYTLPLHYHFTFWLCTSETDHHRPLLPLGLFTLPSISWDVHERVGVDRVNGDCVVRCRRSQCALRRHSWRRSIREFSFSLGTVWRCAVRRLATRLRRKSTRPCVGGHCLTSLADVVVVSSPDSRFSAWQRHCCAPCTCTTLLSMLAQPHLEHRF